MKLVGIICLCVFLSQCGMTPKEPSKINGVSYVASKDSIKNVHVAPLLKIHANYASIMPFGFTRDVSHPVIQYNSDKQWFGETKVGIKQYIKTLKRNGIQTMVKPQIWIWNGTFTGDIAMTTEADWKAFETSYTKFILDYAQVAQENKAAIFCIGTELQRFVDARPNYWNGLIKAIRTVYKGKLTYAANWNEYNQTPFWNALDFIGIDAYFPVSDLKTPTVEACKLGLQRWKTDMKHISDSLKKPVLFTEFGYRSINFTGKMPWLTNRQMGAVNLQAQSNATQAFFETFWHENWVAGGFVWKWHHNHLVAGGNNNTRFTPQNKPAEQVIKDFYSRN